MPILSDDILVDDLLASALGALSASVAAVQIPTQQLWHYWHYANNRFTGQV